MQTTWFKSTAVEFMPDKYLHHNKSRYLGYFFNLSVSVKTILYYFTFVIKLKIVWFRLLCFLFEWLLIVIKIAITIIIL